MDERLVTLSEHAFVSSMFVLEIDDDAYCARLPSQPISIDVDDACEVACPSPQNDISYRASLPSASIPDLPVDAVLAVEVRPDLDSSPVCEVRQSREEMVDEATEKAW